MGLALATGLRAVATWVLLLRPPGIAVHPASLARQLRYAVPFGLAFLLIIPQQQFHQYAVAATVTTAAYAIYAVGCLQLPVVDVLYTPVSEILQLGLAEEERRGVRRGPALFHEAVSRLSFAFLPMMALLFVVAPTLIAFLFTERYLAAAPIFRASLLGIALAALPLDGVMRARAQNRFMLAASAVKLAVTLPLVWLGLRELGPLGAMCGWIAAETIGRGILLARAGQLFGAGLRGVLPWRELSRQALAAVVAMPAAWLAVHALPGARFASLAAAGVAYAAVYLRLCFAAGWVPPEWRALVRLPARAGRVAAPDPEARMS
jgi:O-antigen/teichoic acid export membrane protein